MAAMEKVTNRIVFIAASERYVELIQQTYREHSKEYEEAGEDNHRYSFSVVVGNSIEELSRERIDADIIIARGIISSQLKRSNPEAAIIDIPVGSEIVTTAWRAFEEHGRLPLGIVGSFNIAYAAHGLGDVLKADIKTYLQASNAPASIDAILDRAAADGRRILLCGVNTCSRARSRRFLPVLIGVSRESIWQAISEAKHGALIRRREREKAEQFRMVLNHAYEGVIATDINGIVTVFNEAASEILGVPAATGKPLDAITPRGRLNAIFRNNSDFTNQLAQYDSEQLSVSKASIMLNNDFSGHIITFQKISSIQKAENIIRKKLYAKGHVANYTFDDIIGDSQAIRSVVHEAGKYAAVSSNILIAGETGTGKELIAQGIHNASDRKDAPFVAINCAALAKNLLESELFGYVEGAFTGALKGGKRGLFEVAHSGTLFLDEVSEIPLDLQGRLLRVLQERQIVRLGDDAVIPVDVRVISATNRPLLHEVRNNRFRRDLYYRLNVLSLAVPPLNHREEDVLLLANFYLREHARRFNRPIPSLSHRAGKALLRHRWEGNIRELRNICERLVVLDVGREIRSKDMERILGDDADCAGYDEKPETIDYGDDDGVGALKKQKILAALRACDGNRKKTAARMGISTTTLWRRMKFFGIV